MENFNSAKPDLESPSHLEPLVFKDIISSMAEGRKWSCLRWTKSDWQRFLGDDLFEMRLNRIRKNGNFAHPQWESQCITSDLQFRDLLVFDDGLDIHIGARTYNHDDYWIYFSYFYLKDFVNLAHIDDAISWQDFGLGNLTGKDSTLWIGTAGANTPCHIDTYGWNVVVQLYGTKRWTLFPEAQSEYLYRTRIPYEESSIYSEVGFPRPDLKSFPLLSKTTPYVAVLQPGDVLIVPKHWWHFVECLSFSVSINTWVPSHSDNDDRLTEAIAMFQVGSLSRSFDTENISQFLNPNAVDVAFWTSEQLMETLVNAVHSIQEKSIATCSNSGIESLLDRLKCKGLLKYDKPECLSFGNYCSKIGIDCHNSVVADQSIDDKENVLLKAIVDSFLDERVLSCMKSVLLEKLNCSR